MEKVIKVNNLEETIALGNRLGLLLQPNMLLTLRDVYKRQEIRCVDMQRLDLRKTFCDVLSSHDDIIKYVKEHLLK